MAEAGVELPLMVSGTIEPMGTMLAGQGVEALYASLEHLDLFSIGLNCATGPEFMTDHLRTLSDAGHVLRLACTRTRACPTRTATTTRPPESLALKMRALRRRGLGERGRRLLRHDPGAHPRAGRAWWPGGRRAVPAAARAAAR